MVLAVVVVISTTLQALLALRSPGPWIAPDEFIYAELSKSLAEGRLPAIRGEVTFDYGIGYPVLLAPVWAAFGDASTAHAAAKVVNALVMSSTAVPAYLLARKFTPSVPALLAALLAVAVPSMVYAGTLMTEVALYPAFVWAMFFITTALERPTWRTQAAALGAIAVAAAVKIFAGVLVAAYVVAILLYHRLESRTAISVRGRFDSYRLTWTALALGVGSMCGAAIGLGRSPADALGAYGVVVGNIDLVAVPWWFLLHVSEIDLYVAVLPFAATLLVMWRGVRLCATSEERLFVASVAPSFCFWLLAIAAFSSTPFPGGEQSAENVARLHERGAFVVAPLLLIALMMTLWRPLVRRTELVLTGLLAASLPALIPLDRFLENAYFQALALFPWIEHRELLAWPFGCLALTTALAVLYAARARAALMLAATAMLFLVTAVSASAEMRRASAWIRSESLGSRPSWVDQAVAGQEVAVLWAEPRERPGDGRSPAHRIVWLGEFYNRSLGVVYEIGHPMPFNLPSTKVRLVSARVVLANGQPASLPEFVFVPCNVSVEGMPVAFDDATGARVVRLVAPARVRMTRAPCRPNET